MNESHLLSAIADLSREFGGEGYVRGGGGNTSCKNASTLWIKPSGVALCDMSADKFIAVSRDKLDAMYMAQFPADEKGRETEVQSFLAQALLPESKGRPSVETPLHNSFPQRFVVHTHPALVNGMTCAAGGAETCARLFPDALWVPFIEPGYTLSMKVREHMRQYETKNGKAPEMLFLGNHGLFIAHDEIHGVRALYERVMAALEAEVKKAGFWGEPQRKAMPDADAVASLRDKAKAAMGGDANDVAFSGWFQVPAGALTPDHIVYCKASMYQGDASAESLNAFRGQYGYWPRVIATNAGVFGLGSSRKVADLALELAWDAAKVVRYAQAFGGVQYLEKRFVDFIEGWEVESYRQKQAR